MRVHIVGQALGKCKYATQAHDTDRLLNYEASDSMDICRASQNHLNIFL